MINAEDLANIHDAGRLLSRTVRKVNPILARDLSHALLAAANETPANSQVETILYGLLNGYLASRTERKGGETIE